ncbi:hypothetical protein N7512_007573 [Penicillium capsulatum]|nr:hypothetical protein N7512_007573 [Penicillium capsulatum]
MAPNLAPSKHEFIYDMTCRGELSISKMAEGARRNRSTILRISSNIRMVGGRPRSITPFILEALCDWVTYSKSRTCILTRWRLFCGTNSISKQRKPASAGRLHIKAGQKSVPGSKPESVIKIYVMNTFALSQIFIRIILSMWMNWM